MKKTFIAILTVLAVILTAQTAVADMWDSGSDYDIIRRRYSGTSQVTQKQAVTNSDQNHHYLAPTTNFELYNFVREEKTPDGRTVRIWEPKWQASVINNIDDYSFDNDGNKVYNFDSYAYQLPEATDFSSKTYIGYFQLSDGTVYRYWK